MTTMNPSARRDLLLRRPWRETTAPEDVLDCAHDAPGAGAGAALLGRARLRRRERRDRRRGLLSRRLLGGAAGRCARSAGAVDRAPGDLVRLIPGRGVHDQAVLLEQDRLAVGDSFRSVYDRRIGAYPGPHVVREGDIASLGWDGGPIDVLFVDVLKSWDINDAFLRDFFPHVVPGKTLLLHQDYGWGDTRGSRSRLS